ncbi:tetratricopeptide repeat protein [Silvibacterium acidisoli]|uniref:tetratricopeptide repeat protein n=1 Tax=Acidobacteriaceae bacterium ZG23-2 TaxID=2883246 RepID=UPI00406C4077
MITIPQSGLAQQTTDQPPQGIAGADKLGLSETQAAALQRALDAHDYPAAENTLLPEIQAAQDPAYKDRLLLTIAGIYFLDHDNLHAAVAWKKAEAISPLPPALQFSLAMAYVGMGRRQWATQQLQRLADADTQNALYPYWMGRIDYDSHFYETAIAHFQKAIALNPQMARAYDNLGLCFFYRNQNALAVQNFEKAIALDSHTKHPSPWPHINLAAVMQATGQPAQAESHLREAIRIDPGIASAHFQLGNVLDAMGKLPAAVDEYKQAAQLDSHYAEPHFALARLYRRLGQDDLSRHEVQLYTQLHNPSGHSPTTP